MDGQTPGHNDKSDTTAKSTSSPPPPSAKPPSPPPAWRTYAHFYIPLIILYLLPAPMMELRLDAETSIMYGLFIAVAGSWPAYLVASRMHRSPPASAESNPRFTRQSDIYRAGVLYTYRWLYGTPFNLAFFVGDLLCSYAADWLIGEADQPRSEFLVCLKWVLGNALLLRIVPGMVLHPLLIVDRVLWRALYTAAVDDLVGLLTRPDVKTWMGTIKVIFAQAVVMMLVQRWVHVWFPSGSIV